MHGHLASAQVLGAAVTAVNTSNKTGALTLHQSILLKMFCVRIAFSITRCIVCLCVAGLWVHGNSPLWPQLNVATGILAEKWFYLCSAVQCSASPYECISDKTKQKTLMLVTSHSYLG